MTSTAALRPLASPAEKPHLAALVTRVSTELQLDEEGSLRTQLQRLRAHLDYKRACGESWTEVALYELPAISGKDSLRSPTMVRLRRDIESGRINTVCCTAFARVSRSIMDFLAFFQFLDDHNVEFISLRENCDTATSMGRFLATMFAALGQLEREQTSERTADATAARAERGLFNGGQILGYDPDPQRKGYLKVNEAEAEVVRALFDIYLEAGSMAQSAAILNERGYRTKSFTSRSGIAHAGKKFGTSKVQSILQNPSYVGLKPVNARKRAILRDIEASDYHLVPAVWDPIVDREKYDEAQRLMAANGKSRTNQARPFAHVYVLSRGLLICGECGTPMEGRSGIGRHAVRYHYYACQNRNCKVRVAAPEIEGVILDRLQVLATSDGILDKRVAATNTRLQHQLPTLQKRKRALARELADVEGQLDRLLSQLGAFTGKGHSMIAAKLEDLGERRQEIESAIAEVDEALHHIQTSALTVEPIREALAHITQVFEQLKPIEKKELVRLLLRKATVSEHRITLEIRGETLSDGETLRPGAERFETPDRLPESVTQSVLLYEFPVRLRGLRVAKRLREQRLAGALACSLSL